MLGIREETPEQEAAAKELGLETIHRIAPSGTFVNPSIDDETEDWGNRAILLDRYKRLKKLLAN